MILNPKIKSVLNLIKENIIYENYLFKRISDLEFFFPLKELGYFSPKKAPIPKLSEKEGYFTIPEWNILPYLERISQKKDISDTYIDELLKIIINTTEYHIKNNKCLDNYRTWWYFIKILSNIPNAKISNEIIELIPIWLESRFDTVLTGSKILEGLIPKFLNYDEDKDIKKAEKIVDFITRIKWVDKYKGQKKEELIKERIFILSKPEDNRTEEEKWKISFFNPEEKEAIFFIDQFYLFDSFIKKEIAKKLGLKSSMNIVFILANRLKDIIKEQYNVEEDLSYIWIDTFFYKKEDILEIKGVITLIIAEIILGKVNSKKRNEIDIIFRKFLSNDYHYSIFKRIVLYVIGSNWIKFKKFFWELIDSDTEGLFFNSQYYEPEIYGILERNIEKFSEEEKEKLIKIIEEKVPNKPHPQKKYRDYFKAYKKQRWYSAVKNDPKFSELYKKQKEITKEEEELDFKISTIRVGPGPSPISKEEILKLPNELLSEQLKRFKTVDHWKGPTVGGLADLLKITVEEDPDKFTNNLLPFLDCGFLYAHEILWGFEDAFKKGKVINWEEILGFISLYISIQDFWDDKYIVEGDNWRVDHLWILGSFGSLIKTGVRDYSRPFPENNLQLVIKILSDIIDKLLSSKKDITKITNDIKKDYINYALNSFFGKLIEGLIQIIFRINNFELKTGKVFKKNWKEEIIKKYDEILNKNVPEGYVWLGFYLPDLYLRLNKQWVKSKILMLSRIKNINWAPFIEGYLFNSRVYKELYELMRKNYLKAIDIEFENNFIINHLIQHICVEYLNEDVSIDNNENFINVILNKWNKKQIESLISCSWMLGDTFLNKKDSKTQIEESIKKKEKIVLIWKWIYENKYKGKSENDLSTEDKEIISDLSKLTILLPEINSDNSKWLELSATYIHIGFNSPYFVEYLDFLKDKKSSIKYIGKIFLKILENYIPDYKIEHIRSIVEYLFKNKYDEVAIEVCNRYASRGAEFLRDIYEKYRKQ